MNRCSPLVRGWLAAALGTAWALSAEAATVMVDILVTPLPGGTFLHEIEVTNQGPEDVILVSISDAPAGDPLIDATLTVPPAYLGIYDSGLGFVDLIENTALFPAAVTVSGFSFESSAPFGSAFASFQAFDINGGMTSGSTNLSLIPEPSPLGLLTGPLAILLLLRRRRAAGPASLPTHLP